MLVYLLVGLLLAALIALGLEVHRLGADLESAHSRHAAVATETADLRRAVATNRRALRRLRGRLEDMRHADDVVSIPGLSPHKATVDEDSPKERRLVHAVWGSSPHRPDLVIWEDEPADITDEELERMFS